LHALKGRINEVSTLMLGKETPTTLLLAGRGGLVAVLAVATATIF